MTDLTIEELQAYRDAIVGEDYDAPKLLPIRITEQLIATMQIQNAPTTRLILKFLSTKMEVTAEMVGHHLYGKHSSYSTKSAAALLGQLREHDLVMRIPELKAWRLTKEGREWVNRSNDQEGE